MKRNPLFCLSVITSALILLLVSPYTAAAGENRRAWEGDMTDYSLCDISSEATPPQATKANKKVASVNGGSDYLFFLNTEEDASSLPLDSMDLANALVKLEGERFGTLFPIEYDISTLDTSCVGIQLLHGTVIIPDDYDIPVGMEDITIPVVVYNAENPFQLPVTGSRSIKPNSPLACAAGTSREELQDMLLSMCKITDYEVSGQYVWLANLKWDCSGIDANTPGTYKVTAVVPLPDGILLPDTIQLPYSIIDIQDPDKLTLSMPVFNSHTGNINICWAKDTPRRDLFHLWYKKGGGLWQEDKEEDLMLLLEDSDGGFRNLEILSYYLEENVTYYLSVEYDGEISNILTVIKTPGGYRYDTIEGDRDGGDSVQQNPPDVIQTPPSDVPSQSEHTSSQDKSPEETLQGNQDFGHIGSRGSSISNTNSGSNRNRGPARGSASDGNRGSGSGSSIDEDIPTGSGGISGFGICPDLGETNAGSGSASTNSEADAAKKDPKILVPARQYAEGHLVPEEDASDYTVWSGYRILKLMENNPNQPLVFEKHGIRIEFPTDSDALAHISENSSLRVEIRRMKAGCIYTSISMDGIPLSHLPELTISLPWNPAKGQGSWTAAAEDGTSVEAVYSPVTHSLTFTTNSTGIITIIGPNTPGGQKAGSLSGKYRNQTAALLGGCALAVLLSGILWKCYISRRNGL